MYGTFMGKVIGTITDIDGSIQSVGIDCGSQGLQQIQYEQLVVQGDAVIFIPKWRLDSQRLIREKQLTLRRLKALIDIVSENDEMKVDAEIIHEKYKSKLVSLDETEHEIKAVLEARLTELDEHIKSAKMLSFDAKVQYKSNEISDATFETVKSCTTEVIEHITHETAEIANVKRRIADLELEVREITSPTTPDIQESAVSYLETPEPEQLVQAILPEAPTDPIVRHSEPTEARVQPTPEPSSEVTVTFPEPPQQVTPATSNDNNDNDWLARMEAQ
jgi:DNA-binding transcriptional MerR regulator